MTHNQDITGPEANNHITLYTLIVSPIYMGYKYRTNYCNYNIDSYSLWLVLGISCYSTDIEIGSRCLDLPNFWGEGMGPP